MRSLIIFCALVTAASAAHAGALGQLSPQGAGPSPITVGSPEPASEGGDYALPTAPMPEEEYWRVRPVLDDREGSAKALALEDKAEIPYLMLATAEATAQEVDLSLILAVIKKESSFNKKAQSPVGAKGLMQLMPDTAKWLGLKDATKIFDPATNIKYGTKYLRYLWGEFGEGDQANLDAAAMELKTTRMAIAAYNAGPGNVRKYNDVPPFKETKYYVTKVTEYFSDFETLLAAP